MVTLKRAVRELVQDKELPFHAFNGVVTLKLIPGEGIDEILGPFHAFNGVVTLKPFICFWRRLTMFIIPRLQRRGHIEANWERFHPFRHGGHSTPSTAWSH